VSYYDADSWANHELNEIKCAECGEEFEFETYAELETFADENREDCTMCRTEEVAA
jgi:hypothetical protein